MAEINVENTLNKDSMGKSLVDANVNGNDWFSFLDALGWLESSNQYGIANGV